MKLAIIIFTSALFLTTFSTLQARPAPSKESLNSTFKKITNAIRVSCNNDYPKDDAKFQQCTSTRHNAMKSYFTVLFNFRDTKGINSIEFKKGIICSEEHSPTVNEPGRKKSLELADWVKVKNCYEKALAK